MTDVLVPASRAQALWWSVHRDNQAGMRRRLDGVDEVIVASRRLHVPVNIAALERCLHLVATRHEALRSGFVRRGDELLQCIAPEPSVALRVIDLSNNPAAEANARLIAAAREDARRPFDLERPWPRALLARLAPEESVLVITVLHGLFDDFSHQIVVDELRALYPAVIGMPQPRQLAAAVPFRRFSAWQLDWASDDRLRAQHDYWMHKLDGYRARIELPVLRPRAAVERDTRASLRVSVPKEAWQAAVKIARAERASPFALVIAALSAVLAAKSGQEEIAIGAVYGNRRLAWTHSMIGLVANTLLLRTSLADAPSLRDLLRRVAADWVEALGVGELSFDEIAHDLGVSRLPCPGEAPAYEALVNFLVPSARTDDDAPSWMLPWSPPEDDRPSAWDGCLLHITIWIGGDGSLEVRFRYTAELLSAEVVSAIAVQFRNLISDLALVLDRPATRLERAAAANVDPAPAGQVQP